MKIPTHNVHKLLTDLTKKPNTEKNSRKQYDSNTIFLKTKKIKIILQYILNNLEEKVYLPYKFYIGYKILLLLNEVFPNNHPLTRSVIFDYFIESLLLYEIRTHLSFGTGSAADVDVFIQRARAAAAANCTLFTLIPPTKD